jgi:hypothetical protein
MSGIAYLPLRGDLTFDDEVALSSPVPFRT